MHVNRLERIESADRWDQLLLQLPTPHLLQSWTWGEVKSRHGWEAQRLAWLTDEGQPLAAAQLLLRTQRLPLPGASLAIIYCPKGPLLDWRDPELSRTVLAGLRHRARDTGAVFLKIDPDVPLGQGVPGHSNEEAAPLGRRVQQQLDDAGWRASPEQIQYPNTMVLDLTADEDALLKAMKQKTRYNIRLADRRGVQVRTAHTHEYPRLYQMFAETSARDGFPIRETAYYLDVWETFTKEGLAQPLVAEVDGDPVAGLVVYRFAETAYYLYGMSTDRHREKMPNHLLQWEAIRWAKRHGCTQYDFWGAPNQFDEEDPLWGVYRFKEGFGARVLRTIGPYDLPVKPAAYRLYQRVLPRLLALLRIRGRARTRRHLETA